MLRWLKTVVVSDEEKALVRGQVGIRKASVSEPFDEVSKQSADIETGVSFWPRDEPGGCPFCWSGGVRHGGGASLVCGFCMERGKAGVDTAAGCPGWWVVARGSAPSGRNR
jgi:hypothetical protein